MVVKVTRPLTMNEAVCGPAQDMEVDISISHDAWLKDLPDSAEVCREAAEAAFGAGAGESLDATTEVSIVLTDNPAIQELNRDYRGKNQPTNVLSFASLDGVAAEHSMAPDAPLLLGDIVVAYETAISEAAAECISLRDHLSHLIVHGMLHLLRYDHERDAEAKRMESLETQVLAGLGVADPHTIIAKENIRK